MNQNMFNKFILFFTIFHICTCAEDIKSSNKMNVLTKELEESSSNSNFEQLIIDILYPRIRTIKCFALICDDLHCNIFTNRLFKRIKLYSSYFLIHVSDSEDLLSPYNSTQETLDEIKTEGCKFYIILLANGLQVSRFLQFGDRYRVLNTRANFILLYDIRLFYKNLYYLWTRIVNIVFIREYGGIGRKAAIPWFDLSTVPFPSPIHGVFIPHRLDSWRNGHFRLGVNLFRDKTSDLKIQVLKVVTFQHVPAMVRIHMENTSNETSPIVYTGLEIEILQTLAEQMNFETSIYEPANADSEKWGQKLDGKFTGLLGEMVKFHAEIALGDLHYSPYNLELMDLTIPYNTECLTFLTPESSTDNTWMTLILPFKLYMWLTMITVIFVMGIIFHALAKFYRNLYESKEKTCIIVESQSTSADANLVRKRLHTPFKHMPVHKRKVQIVEENEKPIGLYLFEDWTNTFLYTYCMLLLISLPKVPDGWSLRIIVGWYFLYTTLVVVSYKASMTAILTNPAPKITIDTLNELEKSGMAVGGWGENVKTFFLTSLDPAGQKIGRKFEHVNNSEIAVERVVEGKFAYYENIYELKAASVKRELQIQDEKDKDNSVVNKDRNLHIMTNCIINMPISIGLQKNSPIKTKIDIFIRRVIEGGFVKKWLDDVMQPTLTSEMNIDPGEQQALMTLRKLYAGIGALFIGYFLSTVALSIELAYWHFIVIKHPNFDKYSRTIFIPYNNDKEPNIVNEDILLDMETDEITCDILLLQNNDND